MGRRISWFGIALLAVAPLFFVGCSDPNAQRSAVVREFEGAGAGDVSGSTIPELVAWIGDHPEKRATIDELNTQCQRLLRRSVANWSLRTAEGRVCMAVAQSSDFVTRTADQTAY